MTLLIRHAESAWNEHFGSSRIDVGLPDPPLTARGVEQARAAAERLRREGVRQLLSSPYRRTLHTASIIAEALGIPIEVDPIVRERCAFSCDQGSSPAALKELFPGLELPPLDEIWWGGVIESWPSVEARCRAFRERLRARPDGGVGLAVVSHWGFIRGLTGAELHNTEFIRLDPGAGAVEPTS